MQRSKHLALRLLRWIEIANSDWVGFGCFSDVRPVTLTVTDSAGQSDSDAMVIAHVDQTPD